MGYQELEKTYGGFQLPRAELEIEEKAFSDNNAGLEILSARVELTSSYDASVAYIRIGSCVDTKNGQFKMGALKPYILLGSFVTLKIGYLSQVKEIFRGFIARTEFLNDADEPFVELTVMDVKGVMMASCGVRRIKSCYYSDAVKEIFEKPVYQSLLSKGIIEKFNIRPTPDKERGQKGNRDFAELVSESDYEFVVRAAKKYQFEFYTDVGTVRFRKAREQDQTKIKLGPGTGLLTYRIGYDIRGLVKKMEVRSTEDEKGRLVKAMETFQHKISIGSRAKGLIAETEKVYVDADVCSPEEAKDRLSYLFDKMAFGFGLLECESIGMPELIPGSYIEITGLGEPADNRFYLQQVHHVIEREQGYRCLLTGTADRLGGK